MMISWLKEGNMEMLQRGMFSGECENKSLGSGHGLSMEHEDTCEMWALGMGSLAPGSGVQGLFCSHLLLLILSPKMIYIFAFLPLHFLVLCLWVRF